MSQGVLPNLTVVTDPAVLLGVLGQPNPAPITAAAITGAVILPPLSPPLPP